MASVTLYRINLDHEVRTIKGDPVKFRDGNMTIGAIIVEGCEGYTSSKEGAAGHKENVQAFTIGQEVYLSEGSIDMKKEDRDFIKIMIMNARWLAGVAKVQVVKEIEEAEEIELVPIEKSKK